MKLNLETLSKLERRLHFEIPIETVTEAFERFYNNLQRQVTVKGFRKGKTPIATIRSMYKDRIGDDVARELIQEYYVKGLQEHSLEPISSPQIEFDPITETSPFKFSVQFDIRPEINLKKYEGLKVEKEILEPNEKTVEETLERMRQSRAKEEPLIMERPAKLGDLATIDFEGTIDGKLLDRGSAKSHTMELGASGFIEGFDTGIVGMNINETRELQLKFPNDYHVNEIAGKPVTFKVTLHRLGMKVLPELTDEFASNFGQFKTLEELKNAIREDWRRGEDTRIKKDLKGRLLKALVESNPMDVPPSILRDQKLALIQDMHHRMEEQGMPHDQFEEYKQKWDKDFEESAAFIVRSSFLINAVAEKHDLKAKQSDLDKKIEDYALQTGIAVDKIKEYYSSSDHQSNLRFQITEENVVDFLISKADIKEVPASKIKKDE